MEPIVSERIDDGNTSDFKCGKPCSIKINLEDFIHATQYGNLGVPSSLTFTNTPFLVSPIPFVFYLPHFFFSSLTKI